MMKSIGPLEMLIHCCFGKMSKTTEHINHLSKDQPKWFAVYTKYKCEKYIVDNLKSKNIEAYLPLLNVTKKYTSKIKKYQVPLINSYVFVKITKDNYLKVLQTEYVMNFVKIRKNLISIPEEEINLLKRIVGEYQESITSEAIDWIEGQEVEVVAGSLTGLKGRLIEKKNKNRFAVNLNHIGIQLQIEIEPGLLRPINHKIPA